MPLWDDQCDLVYSILSSLITSDRTGKTLLETGSGTGRISLRLAKEGANVILLDISRDALESSKRMFKNCMLQGNFIIADVSCLPFRDSILDVVWSSGVLEHFSLSQMDAIIGKFMNVTRKHGKLVIIVPNKHAFFYNISRLLDMKTGRWQWGYEEPLTSKDLKHLRIKPIVTRSAGFVYQFNFLSFPFIDSTWHKLLRLLYPELKPLDRCLPGYLVAGMWQK
jgi:ubiquinone/menaquinone biosynthesis C-methylase UbiE